MDKSRHQGYFNSILEKLNASKLSQFHDIHEIPIDSKLRFFKNIP